jgi:hypothetical protein
MTGCARAVHANGAVVWDSSTVNVTEGRTRNESG